MRKIIHMVRKGLIKLFQIPIIIYKRFISPCFPPCCKYYPSCSSYMLTALERFGVIRGLALGTLRLLRCHPWSLGGVDYVPEKFDLFYYRKEHRHR
ncbi:MAG: membrane protein insertion efficiency factor YidD [Oscillospiraceae bacterium]|nr:membrane protein insertion efficiency factor YidD [Oscillospiraceae bacterium]